MNAEIGFIVEDHEDGKALTTLVVGLTHHTEGYSLFQFGLKLENADPEILVQLLKSVAWKKPEGIKISFWQDACVETVPLIEEWVFDVHGRYWNGPMLRFFEVIAKKEIT